MTIYFHMWDQRSASTHVRQQCWTPFFFKTNTECTKHFSLPTLGSTQKPRNSPRKFRLHNQQIRWHGCKQKQDRFSRGTAASQPARLDRRGYAWNISALRETPRHQNQNLFSNILPLKIAASIALMSAKASTETVTMWVLKQGKHNPKD